MDTKEIRRFTAGCSIKAASEPEGILEAIVNVFNLVDRTDERTMPGIFEESLASKMPRGVWHHRWDQPIARTLEAKELKPGDPLLPESLKHLGGLYIKGQFFKEIEDSWQAFLKIFHGLIDEFSIGYRMIEWKYNTEDEILDLTKGEWFEWSPVLVGANQATTVISAKDLTQSDAIQQFLKGTHNATLEDHASTVLDAVDGLISRLERHGAKTLETAKHLSAPALERIDRHSDRLKTLREKGTPSPTEDPEEQKRLRAEIDREFLKTMRNEIGV